MTHYKMVKRALQKLGFVPIDRCYDNAVESMLFHEKSGTTIRLVSCYRACYAALRNGTPITWVGFGEGIRTITGNRDKGDLKEEKADAFDRQVCKALDQSHDFGDNKLMNLRNHAGIMFGCDYVHYT